MSTFPSDALENVPGLLDHLTDLFLLPIVSAVFLRGSWGFDRDDRAGRTCRHRSSKAEEADDKRPAYNFRFELSLSQSSRLCWSVSIQCCSTQVLARILLRERHLEARGTVFPATSSSLTFTWTSWDEAQYPSFNVHWCLGWFQYPRSPLPLSVALKGHMP